MASAWKRHLVIGLGFLLLSLAMTWPLGFSAERYVVDPNLDQTAGLYNLWWFYYSVVKLRLAPWWNPLINFPDGYSMVFYPMQIPYGLFSLPFQIWLAHPQGLNLAYNLALVLSFTLSAYFTFLLVRDFSGSSRAGFLAGLIFSFAPFHFWHLPRPHVAAVELLVLAVLSFFRLMRSEKTAPALAFGLSLVLLVYASPPYLVYLGLFLAVVALYYGITDRAQILRLSLVKQFLAALALFLPLAAPLLSRLAHDYFSAAVPILPRESEALTYSGNLLGYFFPGATQKFYPAWLTELSPAPPDLKYLHGVGGYEIFLGYVPLGLALFTLTRLKPKGRGLWLAAAIFFFLLSLGPALHLGPRTFTSWPLPQAWLSAVVPFLRLDRAPVRFAVWVQLSVAVLAGLGLAELGRRLRPAAHLVLSAALCLVVLWEFRQAPLALNQIPVPEFHQRLAQEPGDFAVLDLPLLPEVYRYSGTFQRWHHKRLVIDLTGRAADQRSLSDPLFRAVAFPPRFLALAPEAKTREKQRILRELARRRLRYVVLFRRFLSPQQETQLVQLLSELEPMAQFAEGELFLVFQFPVSEQ